MARFEITSPDGRRFEITAPDGTSQDEALAYAQQQMGVSSANEEPKEQDGPLTRGWNKMVQSVGITGALATKDTEGAALRVTEAAQYQAANPGSTEGNELMSAWQRGDGISGGLSEVAGEFKKDWNTAPSTIAALRGTGKNLLAMGAGVVEQTPNMLIPMAGMIGGGAAGAATPVPGGMALGAFAGASTGNALVEGGGMAQEALHKAGINPNDTNAVRAYLEQNGDTLLAQAGIKGAVIGAIDTATMGIGGKLLMGPGKAAAGRALLDMGVDITDKAAVKAAMASTDLAARVAVDPIYRAATTGGRGLARNATVAAMEPAGEFAGEYLGQGLATGDYNEKDAFLEAASSIGQSGMTFAGQKLYAAAKYPFKAEAGADGAAPIGSGVTGNVDVADVLGAPEADTEADKALYTPKNLTALDRVNEIDAKVAELSGNPATTKSLADALTAGVGRNDKPVTTQPDSPEISALLAERASITASWPKAAPGAATSFTTETGARLDGQYALMEAGDLTTSHDESLRPTATYPKELQPRERDRHASEVQIQGIVGKLDPARLGESGDVATGAPIVGADGLVESGNARTIALKRVYQANGLKADGYKQYLKDNAERFGITPESVDAMQKPVLVRVRQTPVNRAEFARQANASTVARMSPSEQAKSDAAQIDSLDDLNPDESGDFMSGSSTPFVRRFLAKLAGTEQAGLIDATGQLSQAGYTRIRNAVLAKAYGDSPVLLRMVESLDDNSRNVSKALLRVAPQVAKAREAMREGALHDVDLIPDLMAAVQELSDLKDKGTSVDEALAQAGMFGDKLSPESRQLLVLLSENARSPRRIADFIQAYLDALTAAGNPGQGSMFGDNAAPSKGDLMTAARRANNGDTATSGTDAGNAKPAEKGGSQPQDAPGNQTGNGGNEVASGSAQQSELTQRTAAPMTTAESIGHGMDQIAKGMEEGARDQAADYIRQGKTDRVTYRKKESIDAAKSNQNYNTKDNADGSVTVIGVKNSSGEWVGIPPTGSAAASQTRNDGTNSVVPDTGLTILHGSGNANLTADGVQIIRQGQKQGKKGRTYGGLYGTSEADMAHAEGYASMMGGQATIYDIRVRPGTKILNKIGDITRLSENYINELVSQGYGVVVGKDPRGRTEYVVIDTGAIESMRPSKPKVGAGDTAQQSEWVAFPPDSGTLGIPRAEMPQVKGEHRGALIQFLDGLGITYKTVEMPATDLKPTQAEFSTKKAEGWKERKDGSDRSVLASSDGYILDGHHQWVAALAMGETEQVIQFSVPIKELLAATFRFPSVQQSEGSGNVVQLRTQARQDFKDALPDQEKAAARVKDLSGDKFTGKAGGKDYATRKDWGTAIMGRYKELADKLTEKETKVGELSGFDVMFVGEIHNTEYRSALRLMTPISAPIAFDPTMDPVGMAMRAGNALVEVAREPTKTRKIIEEAKAKRESLESRLDAPFPLAEQLANKVKEVSDLEDKVMNYGKAAPASLTFDPDEWANAYTPLFRRTAAFPAGLSPARVKEVIDYAVKGLRNPPVTKYVATVADLPFSAPPDVAGVFWDGKVWMVAENITSAEHAREVFAHETLGHYGLRGFFGDMLDGALSAIHDRNPRVRLSVIDWKARNADLIQTYKSKYGMSDADVHAIAIEEAMSNWAQERGPINGALRLISLVQRAIRAMGMKRWANTLEAKTNAEALDMLKKARMFVRDGTKLKTPKVDALYPAMADPTLADDLTRQEAWLQREAKLRGFKSIDDLAEKNYKVFESLAALWRKKNPVDVALMSRKFSYPLVSGRASLEGDIAAAAKKISNSLEAGAKQPVEIGRTPHVLSFFTNPPLPMVMDATVQHKVFLGKHKGKSDGVTPDMLVRAMYRPALVFKDGGSFNIVTNILTDLGPLMVSVKASGEWNGKPAAIITSIHPRENGVIADWINGNDRARTLIYADELQVPEVITGRLNPENTNPAFAGRDFVSAMEGINTIGEAISRTNPTLATSSISDKPTIAKQGSPVNSNYRGMATVATKLQQHLTGKGLPKIKTRDDLTAWIAKHYRGDAADMPLFSRAPAAGTQAAPPAKRTAADIISASAGTARPVDFLVRKATQAVSLDRLTTAIYNKGAFLLDRYTPEAIKAGMVSDYGIPEAVTDMRAVVQGRQKQQTRAAGVLLERLATLTRAEARVAYQWMNSEDPQSSDYFMAQLPPESIKTLAEVEKMIDDLSKEAVSLGQLDPEAYQRNRFAYLRRSYVKHEAELTKGETAMRKRAISILGDQYKGRGMTDAAPMRQIQNLAPEWWNRKTVAGKADKGLKGERFIRLERRAPVGAGTQAIPGTGGKQVKPKLLEIAYWPASESIPAKYGAWDQAGTWEVRDTKGADLILWRDFTAQEREGMGEIDEARYAIAKTLHGMIHDVETGKYLQWLAQNHAKKEGEKFAGTIIEASDRMRDVFKPGEWVKIPDTVITGTKVKKYGALAGRYLPGPIWNDVRQVVGFRYQPLGETYAKIHRAWKTSKTALSPAVHMNNVMANFVMADWHDVTAGHILKALKLMLAKDAAAAEVIARFSDSGGSIGTWAAKELQQDQLRPIIEALEKELGLAGNVAGQVGVMSALQLVLKGQFPAAWEAAKPSKPGKATVAAARAMLDLYEAEDQVFRLAAWLRAKEEGATDLEAGKLARKSFLDYSINAPWVQMLRNTALPFVAFTYRAVPMMLETAAKKPWKLLKLGMLAGAINALGYMLSGGDEDDERKLLPEEKAGRVWGIVPKLIRMPWNDANGSPVFLDIRRYVPVGDVLDIGQSHAAVPLLPGMTPGGPLAVLMELAINKAQFTGRDIRLETDTTVESAAKVADHLYKAFAPNIILLPGTHAFTGAMNAGTGKTDTFGREQSLAQSVVSSVGIKMASYPKDVLQLNAQREAQFKMMEIDRNITALKREYQKHGLTTEQFQAKAADQMAKKRKVMEDFQKRAAGR